MSDENAIHQDRRVELVTVKVATLEERSIATAAAQARIEKKLDDHVIAQTEWQDRHSRDELSFQQRVSDTLDVIREQTARNKGILAAITFIGAAIWAAIVVFKDNFLNIFNK